MPHYNGDIFPHNICYCYNWIGVLTNCFSDFDQILKSEGYQKGLKAAWEIFGSCWMVFFGPIFLSF